MVSGLLDVYPVNATTHFTYGRTMDNLERSRDSETGAAKEFYQPCLAVAESEQEKGAVKSLKCSAEVSRGAAALIDRVFRKTQHAAEEPHIGDLRVCQACGYIVEGLLPEKCPICDDTGYTIVK
jgi:rubrerythrin